MLLGSRSSTSSLLVVMATIIPVNDFQRDSILSRVGKLRLRFIRRQEPLQIPGSRTFYTAFRAGKEICEVAHRAAIRYQEVPSMRHKGGCRARVMPSALHGRAGVWQG